MKTRDYIYLSVIGILLFYSFKCKQANNALAEYQGNIFEGVTFSEETNKGL